MTLTFVNYIDVLKSKLGRNFCCLVGKFVKRGIMEKEKEQELEWAEAQEIVISEGLVGAAKQQLRFLAEVDRNRCLYDGPVLDRAILRYTL
jgi:hypothetical protein